MKKMEKTTKAVKKPAQKKSEKSLKEVITAEKNLTIYEKLEKIQKNLKAPKNQHNSFGKYKYRSCEDILEAVKPLLNGVSLTLDDEVIMVGDRFYVKATATFFCKDGHVQTTALAREAEIKKGMDSSQITGATSSYARKYALNGLFLIDDSADSDTMNKGTEKKAAAVKKVDHKAKIKSILFKKGAKTAEEAITMFNSITGLTVKNLNFNAKTAKANLEVLLSSPKING